MYVDTLPCETLTPENYQQYYVGIVSNDKSQGSVATYLRCGGIFTTTLLQITAECTLKTNTKSVNI